MSDIEIDEERIRDQLAIEQRLRALEDAVGTIRDPRKPPNRTNILTRLEALEHQLKNLKKDES